MLSVCTIQNTIETKEKNMKTLLPKMFPITIQSTLNRFSIVFTLTSQLFQHTNTDSDLALFYSHDDFDLRKRLCLMTPIIIKCYYVAQLLAYGYILDIVSHKLFMQG